MKILCWFIGIGVLISTLPLLVLGFLCNMVYSGLVLGWDAYKEFDTWVAEGLQE